MQTITISATKARQEFFDLLMQVAIGNSFVVKKDNQEVALVSPIKRGTDLVGLKKAMDALHGVAKDFDLSKSLLRDKRAKAWLRRIRGQW